MNKIVFTFGIIAGLICGGMFFINIPEDGQMDFSHGALYGYVTMVIALSTIFFAVRQYRDQHSNGTIKFGKAFLIGLYITLIATLIYVLAWEIFFTNYVPDFGEQYIAYLGEQMAEKGQAAAAIEDQLGPQREMMMTYQDNRYMRMAMTCMELLPVGLLMSLISAGVFGIILRKKVE